jgi:hypothetical protein
MPAASRWSGDAMPLAICWSAAAELMSASGEGYTIKDSALNGIDAVKRDASTARTEDQT